MYANKNILVLGFARSGYAVTKLLVSQGASVVVNDIATNHSQEMIDDLEALGVTLILGEHPQDLLQQYAFDLVVKNPGVPLDHFYMLECVNQGLEVSTEVEVAYNCMPDAKYIAITGTNGKTTTASLIYFMLKNEGFKVHLVGNIGNPISNYYDSYNDKTFFVVELSAQQLHDMKNFKADVAVLTNVSEAHLEFFHNKDFYYSMKKRIFNNMDSDGLAIINADDEDSLKLTFDLKLNMQYFSVLESVDGAYLQDEAIIYNDYAYSLENVKLVGMHNYSNIMCAIIAAKYYNVSDDNILKSINNFNGVHHRLEYVRKINGVRFYNDSKSTNISSCKIALNSFYQTTILILGGLDRGQDFSELIPHMNYVSRVYCYGETKDRIKHVMDSYKIDCHVMIDLQEAILHAHDYASFGNIVLFSPACASWDEYKNFEERGNIFKLIVNSFKN